MSNCDTFSRLEYCSNSYELIHTLLNTGGGLCRSLEFAAFFFFFSPGELSFLSSSVLTLVYSTKLLGLSGGSVAKNQPANVGDTRDVGSIPDCRRSFGKGNGNPPQYSCLENFMDRGAWQATVNGIAKSWTQLSEHKHI